MFTLEIIERDHPIGSDIGETSVQRGQCLLIERRTVGIAGVAKILQQIARLFIGKPVDQ